MNFTRRQLLGTALAAGAVRTAARAAGVGDGPCATATSKITIAPESEPGSRMVVSGQVFRHDGVTPAAGVIMYAYHTDAQGIYNEQRSTQMAPRLQGWLKTDAQGRYEYRTIRPAQYPNATIAAHVHYHFWGPGVAPQYSDELLFDDDAKVTEEVRRRSAALGKFAYVIKGTMREGVLYVTQNFRLKEQGDRIQENNRHGENACHVAV
jgi:protocatechuate 3,4-dioxygenase, beta subunit